MGYDFFDRIMSIATAYLVSTLTTGWVSIFLKWFSIVCGVFYIVFLLVGLVSILTVHMSSKKKYAQQLEEFFKKGGKK